MIYKWTLKLNKWKFKYTKACKIQEYIYWEKKKKPVFMMIYHVFRLYNFISRFQIYFSSYNLIFWVIYSVELTFMEENRCKSIIITETFCLICSKLSVRKMLQLHYLTWFQFLTVPVFQRIFQICSLFFLTVN